MEVEATQDTDSEARDQLILLAASHHNLESLRPLLRNGSASVQDPDSGFTPLHAAIAACDPAKHDQETLTNGQLANGSELNGATNGIAPDAEEAEISAIEAAARSLKMLLQNGAIWNDVDKNNETPGCLALRLGLKELYDIMVDAGVRAEMLLNRLDEYEQLNDNDDDGDDEDEVSGDNIQPNGREVNGDVTEQQEANGHADVTVAESRPTESAGQAELNNEDYLQSSLHFQDGRILDNENNGVMMAWETGIMRRTADLLITKEGSRILNIGHGMGIIDTFLNEKSPSMHHIIEAHPAILARMRQDGWYDKSNVTVHEGRWQDLVPEIIEDGILFDAIYFDTFAEDYKALREFFNDHLIALLDDQGKWGFFNGLGADRQICYDVYGKVVEMDLFEAGFDTEWETIEVPKMDDAEWQGVKQRYWTLARYRLPICEFIG